MSRQKLWKWGVPLALLGVTAYALAEDLTLTTYYPSPRGVYKDVRVTDRLAVGTTAPTAQVEVVALSPTIAITTDQTSLLVSVLAATRFNTFDDSLTNTAASFTNQAINTSGSNQLTNVGLTVSASGAERNYGLLVPQGQVGIGTTVPAATTALDVAGKLRVADGTEGADKVLTSDASGVARWAAPPSGTAWRKIGTVAPGLPNGEDVQVATDELPPSCTTVNQSCQGILLRRNNGFVDWVGTFTHLSIGGGLWYSVDSNDMSSNFGMGTNGDTNRHLISQAPPASINSAPCYLYDDWDPPLENSPSHWWLRGPGSTFGCEVWVSGF
ncbi:MAG: hypothetical protein HYY15_02950 [Candidatus Omnitrophica bacterium]|nr:hypothetical protein [Candidatus Omnitrophota bacterium]